MPSLIDLSGERFGELVVMARAEGQRTRWRCRCDCGAETVVEAGNLRAGRTQSCGGRAKHPRLRRPVRFDGDTAYIQLTKGMETVVDLADANLGGFNWQAAVTGRMTYAHRVVSGPAGRRNVVLIHRVIAERAGLCVGGVEVDHRDGNGLNNRRQNLRVATTAQNQHNSRRHVDNTSGVKGVHRRTVDGRWEAKLQVDGTRLHLGTFATREDAAAAYAEAALLRHGVFARPDAA